MATFTQEQKNELQNQDLAFDFTSIDQLVQEREADLNHLKAISTHLSAINLKSRQADLLFNFVQCYGGQDLVDFETSVKRLDQRYWKKLVDGFNFEKLVSISELKTLREDIRTHKTPEFTQENVENFIYNLWSDRYLIFARKIDSALQNLSDDYKNNVNHLFTGKIVVSSAHKSHTINMDQCRQIDEIRQAIRQKMNLSQEFIPTYDILLNWDLADLEWLDIDFDLMRIKKFKNNNLHIQFSEDLVTHFNEVLAYIHKNRLNKDSLSVKAKPYARKRTKFKEFDKDDLPTLKHINDSLKRINEDKFTIPKRPNGDTLYTLLKLENYLSFNKDEDDSESYQIDLTLKTGIKAKELFWLICDGGIELVY